MSASQHLVVMLQGSRPTAASIEITDVTQDPYQLIKAWSGLPRAVRLAMKAVGLDAQGLARLALTLCRNGAPCTIRPGHRLEITLTPEEPAAPPAPRVVIVRHPEWAGLATVEEGLLHSP